MEQFKLLINITICIICQLLNTIAGMERLETIVKGEAGTLIFDENPIAEKNSDSLLACSHLCVRDTRCKSAIFIEDEKKCALLQITKKKSQLTRQKPFGVFYLEKVNTDLPGSKRELAVPSCKSLSPPTHPSGVYWVDPDGGSKINAFRVYCEMDTDGGGWTLVWSYAFTDYENFKSKANAVSPSPEWPDISADIDVPVSTTPPLHEHDFNALDFSLWKQLGQEIFVKSNVNNWLVCSPNGGSFVDWRPGKITCEIANKIAGTHCADGSPPVKILFKDCGPQLFRGNKSYYYFESCTKYRWPIHDPCAKKQENQLRDVQDPHGSIFVR